ncbi:hypothetical protein O6H91_14G038100 [Diphasiastrum complanatum]|uniref:Uncharacterized protein n=1 Tax=Diphasiastrum complanatum TaxID=34168 RepID=A0ACC2BN96_DIPCM|nr:hypothetical protein O6H91_14G038100 [Diphasiastrum complanatum]
MDQTGKRSTNQTANSKPHLQPKTSILRPLIAAHNRIPAVCGLQSLSTACLHQFLRYQIISIYFRPVTILWSVSSVYSQKLDLHAAYKPFCNCLPQVFVWPSLWFQILVVYLQQPPQVYDMTVFTDLMWQPIVEKQVTSNKGKAIGTLRHS